MKLNRTSKTSMMAEYLNPKFWMNPENHWWNDSKYTQSTKDRMNKLVQDLIKGEKNISRL